MLLTYTFPALGDRGPDPKANKSRPAAAKSSVLVVRGLWVEWSSHRLVAGARLFSALGVWGILGALSLTACSKPLTEGECDQLLDHYTEKLVLSENPSAPGQVILEKQRLARELARREPVFEYEQCDENVSRRQFDCAMTAGDVDSIERCLTL